MPGYLEIPGGVVESVYLPHGPMEVLGLVFTESGTGKKLAYFTDCKSVHSEARALAEGADVVVLDGLRPEPHPSHMSISEACQVAREMKAPRTYITHMTFKVDHESVERDLPDGPFGIRRIAYALVKSAKIEAAALSSKTPSLRKRA